MLLFYGCCDLFFIDPACAVLEKEDHRGVISVNRGLFIERVGYLLYAFGLPAFYSVQEIHILFLNFKEF